MKIKTNLQLQKLVDKRVGSRINLIRRSDIVVVVIAAVSFQDANPDDKGALPPDLAHDKGVEVGLQLAERLNRMARRIASGPLVEGAVGGPITPFPPQGFRHLQGHTGDQRWAGSHLFPRLTGGNQERTKQGANRHQFRGLSFSHV
jgi:hypothetical protein